MAKCVICKSKDTVEKYRPFCSARCADIDLYRWSAERYTVPVDDMAYEDSVPDGTDITH